MASTTTNINVPNLVRDADVHCNITVHAPISSLPFDCNGANDLGSMVVHTSK